MEPWSDSPIVSFSRDGQVFELGRGPDDPVLHMYGSTGLGLAPVSFASSDRLTGDGSIVRGVRYESREVFIPLLIEAKSTGELTRLRRDLNSLLAPHRGMVDVRIEDPATGTDRMVRGYLKDGLDGDFGTSYYGAWQTLGLTFECPDPWWLGPEKGTTLRLNPGSKPFLSEGEISRRNLVPNPFGPGAESTDFWKAYGGTIVPVTDGGRFAAQYTKTDDGNANYCSVARSFTPPAESVVRFSADVKVTTPLDRMRLYLYPSGGVELESTSTGNIPQSPEDGWVRHSLETAVKSAPEGGSLSANVWPFNATVPLGEGFMVRDVMFEIDPAEDAPYFDGDSPGCKWVGGAQGPESIMWDPSSTSPFFPVVLAQSAVVGEFTVNIGGEGPVYPAWEIHGPGEDLRIVRGTERIAIDGVLRKDESILIDTATGRIVPDLWEDVSLDTQLFPLTPGAQTITVTMVGATTDTRVRLTYRERHLEGY